MKLIRILRSHRPSFSMADNAVSLTAPRSWRELTQEQLRYVFTLLATFADHTMVKTYMFIRFTGIHVVRKDRFGWQCYVRTTWWGKRKAFTLQAWQIESLLQQLNYIDTYEGMGVRLEDIHGLHAVDILFHDLSFLDYLNAEKYYQLYMQSHDDQFIEKLALILYRKKDGSMAKRVRLSAGEMLGVYMWYADVKYQFSQAFKYFFKRIDPEDAEDFDMRAAMDTQIRALTEGDITKENEILQASCWRALTELNAKAREADEFNRKYNKQ